MIYFIIPKQPRKNLRLLEKAMQCNTAEDLIAYAKTEGVDITKEEAEAYLDELSECELKDGDLKHVAGGASDTHECRDLEQPY